MKKMSMEMDVNVEFGEMDALETSVCEFIKQIPQIPSANLPFEEKILNVNVVNFDDFNPVGEIFTDGGGGEEQGLKPPEFEPIVVDVESVEINVDEIGEKIGDVIDLDSEPLPEEKLFPNAIDVRVINFSDLDVSQLSTKIEPEESQSEPEKKKEKSGGGVMGGVMGFIGVFASLFASLEPVQNAIQMLKDSFGDMLNQAFIPLEPVLNQIVGLGMSIIQSLLPVIMTLFEILSPFLSLFANLIKYLLPLLDGFMQLLNAVLKPIAEFFGALFGNLSVPDPDPFISAISGFATAGKNVASEFDGMVIEPPEVESAEESGIAKTFSTAGKIFSGLAEGAGQLFSDGVDIAADLAETALTEGSKVAQVALEAGSDVLEAGIEAGSEIVQTGMEEGSEILQTGMEVGAGLLSDGIGLAETALKESSESFQTLVETSGESFKTLVKESSETAQLAIETAGESFDNLVSTAGESFDKAIDTAGSSFDNLVSTGGRALESNFSFMKSSVTDITGLLETGITSFTSGVFDTFYQLTVQAGSGFETVVSETGQTIRTALETGGNVISNLFGGGDIQGSEDDGYLRSIDQKMGDANVYLRTIALAMNQRPGSGLLAPAGGSLI